MAKKQKSQAMVNYNPVQDSFELYIRGSEKEEWGFCCSTQCMAIEDETETNFIHHTFLNEVLKCASLGYEIIDGRD